MNKMLVPVFDTEPAAYEGLSALQDLHSRGSIALYATGVITKDDSGSVLLKQADDRGPVRTVLGLVKARIEHAKQEQEARVETLQNQLKEASDRKKALIEKRIAEVKADYAARDNRLKEAWEATKQALA